MSKLERQLDDIEHIAEVPISWPLSEAECLAVIEQRLKIEIDQADNRVPLDLRGVKGAPEGLVELIFDLNDYAESKGKRIKVSHALPPMRNALMPGTGRKQDAMPAEPEKDVSEVAREALGGEVIHQGSLFFAGRSNRGVAGGGIATVDAGESADKDTAVSLAMLRRSLQKLIVPLRSNSPAGRLLRLSLITAAGTALLVIGYWIFLNKFADDSYRFKPIRKTFEESSDG